MITMKTMAFIVVILRLISGIGCIAIGAYMAINNVPKWGWFLFSGILLLGFGFSYSDKKNNEKNNIK